MGWRRHGCAPHQLVVVPGTSRKRRHPRHHHRAAKLCGDHGVNDCACVASVSEGAGKDPEHVCVSVMACV